MKVKRILLLALTLLCVLALFACDMIGDGPSSTSEGCKHEWGEPYEISAATCQERAQMAKDCKKCTETKYYADGELAAHDLEINEVLPTCSSAGHRTEICKTCGNVNNITLPASHDYEDKEWVVTTEPTEEDTGEATIICSKCYSPSTKELPVLNETDYTLTVIDEDNKIYSYSEDGIDLDVYVSNYEFSRFSGANPFKFDLYVITGYNGSRTELTLPKTYKGCPVIGIDMYAFKENTALVSVVIPEPDFTVTIEDFAEAPEEELPENFELKLGYEYIGYHAFDGCTSLASVTVPSSVTSLADGVFLGCTSLESISLDGVIYMESEVFYGCASLESVSLPEVVEIRHRAFYGCSSLSELNLGARLETISSDAFKDCTSLTELVLPTSLTSIACGAFAGCNAIESITAHPVSEYGYDVSVAHLFGSNYYTSNAEYVPESLIEIILVDYEDIPSYILYDCASVERVVLPEGVKSIGNFAFYGCPIKAINIPNTVTSIGYKSLNNIKEAAFTEYNHAYYIGNEDNPYHVLIDADDYTLTEVTHELELHEGTKIVYRGVFDYVYGDFVLKVTVPEGILDFGGHGDYGFSRYMDVYYKGSFDKWCGVLSRYIHMPYMRLFLLNEEDEWEELTEIVIPEGTIGITEAKFAGYYNVTSVTLPASLEFISEQSFWSCEAIENVYYKGTLEDLFNLGCSGVNGNSPLHNAEHFYMLDEEGEWFEVTRIVIPESVTTIYTYFFYNFDGIEKILVHSGVDYIGVGGFEYCDNLTKVFYQGTEEEWWSVSSNGSANRFGNAVVYFYSENEPTVEDYLENPDLALWHYNDEDEVEEWSAATNYADGKTYVYTSTTVSLSDEYWSLITLLKDSNSLDQAGFTPEEIEIINGCATKADYEAHLAEVAADANSGITYAFANGRFTASQPGQVGMVMEYIEIEGAIYTLFNNTMQFTVDYENSRLVKTIIDIDEFITTTHYFNEVVAE